MTDSPPLILASQSPYKHRLMARLGIPFESRSPAIDETRCPKESPREMTRRLARQKAEAVARQEPKAWVLAGDQTAADGDHTIGKPGTVERAVAQLQRLQGSTHHLITSIALRGPDGSLRLSTSTYEMVMRPLSEAQIRDYIDEDQPLDCAGSIKIEAGGIRLFKATYGDDPTAIEGLPLTHVWTLLLDAGLVH